jgi:hypothetical protein
VDSPRRYENFTIHVVGDDRDAFSVWEGAFSSHGISPDLGSTLLLFHCEFVGSVEAVRVPSPVPEKVPLEVDPSQGILRYVHRGLIRHVIWFRPEWSSHFASANTTARLFYVGKDESGQLKVTCPDDYFVFQKLFAPRARLKEVAPFLLQVLPLSDMYRRRTHIEISTPVFIGVDISYFTKQDPIIQELRRQGLDSKEAKFLKSWKSGICLDTEEEIKVQQYQLIENTLSMIFEKSLYSLPKDIFLARVKAAFPVMCSNAGRRIWENLYYVLSTMSANQLDIVREKGLPADASTYATPTFKQVGYMMDEIVKFHGRCSLPMPFLITISDTHGGGEVHRRSLLANLQLVYGPYSAVVLPDAKLQVDAAGGDQSEN